MKLVSVRQSWLIHLWSWWVLLQESAKTLKADYKTLMDKLENSLGSKKSQEVLTWHQAPYFLSSYPIHYVSRTHWYQDSLIKTLKSFLNITTATEFLKFECWKLAWIFSCLLSILRNGSNANLKNYNETAQRSILHTFKLKTWLQSQLHERSVR